MHDASAREFLYLPDIVAKVPGKNLLVMLAQERCLQIERAREIRKAQREARGYVESSDKDPNDCAATVRRIRKGGRFHRSAW